MKVLKIQKSGTSGVLVYNEYIISCGSKTSSIMRTATPMTTIVPMTTTVLVTADALGESLYLRTELSTTYEGKSSNPSRIVPVLFLWFLEVGVACITAKYLAYRHIFCRLSANPCFAGAFRHLSLFV